MFVKYIVQYYLLMSPCAIFLLFSNPVSLGQKYILEPIPLPRSSLARYQRGAVGFFPSSRNKLSGEVESTFFGVYF